jgi:hypothetical protein
MLYVQVLAKICAVLKNLYLCNMGSYKNIEEFIKELKTRLKKEMPKIRKEISIYENKVASGQLNQSPKAGPQFNG